MSKAFTKETDQEDDEPSSPDILPIQHKNYVTPNGFANLQNELKHLVSQERPEVVKVVQWAAGNGDRSENGDYIYGKKRLREIDRRIRYLTKRIENAQIVDPALQQNMKQVFFGATVTYLEKQIEKSVKIVGIDEADLTKGTISWVSPLAKALLKSAVGDQVKAQTPSGVLVLKILRIVYD